MDDMTKIKCNNCGKENLPDAKNCAYCGKPLGLSENGTSGTHNKPPQKPNRWLIILLIALFGVATCFWLKNKSDQSNVEIIAKPNNDTMGSVIGGGVYVKDTVIEIVAIPSDGFRFVSWDDGNTDKVRKVKTIEKQKFVAIFEVVPPVQNPHSEKIKIIAEPANPDMGTVVGSGEFVKDTIIWLKVAENDKYKFERWDDGSTENPRQVKVVDEHRYIAIFKKVEEPFRPVEQEPGQSYSKQKEFDELCGEFDRRMDVEPSFENAYQLITVDYETLQQILQMLDEYPDLKAEPKSHYVECFEKRAGNAVEIIEKAIYSPLLPPEERDELISKYRYQIDEIKKIRNNL